MSLGKRFISPGNIKSILVILQVLVNQILTSYHESPTGEHTGISRTIHKIQTKYYWTTLIKDTTEFIKSCLQCQKNKNKRGDPSGY